MIGGEPRIEQPDTAPVGPGVLDDGRKPRRLRAGVDPTTPETRARTSSQPPEVARRD